MILSNNTMTIAAQVKSQSSVAEHSSEVVNIPDKYLLNAMLEQGDQNGDGRLTTEELKSVKQIYISDADKNALYDVYHKAGTKVVVGRNETYTVRVSSDDHADVSVQLVYGTIAFKENSGVLYIGSSRQLEATGENCKDVTYASDNETVASVDANGKVTAKAAGTAVITATSAAGKTAQYKLTVKMPSVKMNVSAKTLYVKGSPAAVTLKATTAGVTGKVTYTSSKPSVAAVAANGKVTAKATGTAVITAKCGNYKATCKITVKKPSVKASASAKTVFVGGTSQITVKKTGVSGKVTYTSSNKSVAVVSAGGKVTAKKAGTATITVKCGSYKATCKITVKKGSLKITSKTAVSVKAKKTTAIKAAATSKAKITYRSSNTKVATVSSKGVVKGVKKGKAVIYVSSNGITKKVTVTVK